MAFKMKGSPMQRNFGIGDPMKKTTYDEETNTYYKDGRALRHNVRSETRYSSKEAEAAEQLGSGKVDRAHRKHKRKAGKMGTAKGLSQKAVRRRNTRKAERARKAKDRAEELTEKRFAKTEKVGQDAYNTVIERYNKKAKDRAAQKNK